MKYISINNTGNNIPNLEEKWRGLWPDSIPFSLDFNYVNIGTFFLLSSMKLLQKYEKHLIKNQYLQVLPIKKKK